MKDIIYFKTSDDVVYMAKRFYGKTFKIYGFNYSRAHVKFKEDEIISNLSKGYWIEVDELEYEDKENMYIYRLRKKYG